MKKIIFIMFMLPLFICGICERAGHWNIPVHNNSNIDIYYSAERVGGKYFQDEVIPQPSGPLWTPRGKHIKPGETTSSPEDINFREKLENVLSYADSIRVYFFDANAYDEIADEIEDIETRFDYSDPRIYLGYKSYTWDDLERLNWQITYPF